MTTAQWMRRFVTSHPEYQRDSRVSDSITYDLLMKCKQIGKREIGCPDLFESPRNKSSYVPFSQVVKT